MAAGTEQYFIVAKYKILGTSKMSLTSDTLKCALCTNSQTLYPGFLGSSGDCRYADLTGEVANGNGYTTGGVTLTSVTVQYYVSAASVVAGGSGGTNGAVTITGTTGTGTKFQATGTITSNALAGALTITVQGAYTAIPTNTAAEPITGGSLTGATVLLTMGAVFTAANAAWSSATFLAKYAVIYDNTATNKDLIGYVDLETTVGTGVSVTAGTLTVSWNSNGILTFT